MTMTKTSMAMVVGLIVCASTAVEAQARQFNVSRARVRFTSEAPLETINGVSNTGSGALSLDPANLSSASGTITVPVASLRTGIELRDEHLVGPDWLDAGSHPNATFEITGVSGASRLTANQDATLRVTGRFTIHGQTHNVTADVRAKWDGSNGIRASARFTIQLSQYGVSINPAVRLKVSNDIQIVMDIRATAR